MLFKLSNLNSNLALTLGYLNPALKNSALYCSNRRVNIDSDGVYCLVPALRFGTT